MDGYNTIKKYESSKIPRRQSVGEHGQSPALQQTPSNPSVSFSDGMYYEIEYDAHPIPGVGKFVAKPQQIKEPEKDEIRDIFRQMREIGRTHRPIYNSSVSFDRLMHYANASVFYEQGLFMKDFTDDYTNKTSFSQYFPNYQAMGYEQLRTYFTWRTEVRAGNVSNISLSYAFVYIYELLGNIGVSDPLDGLEKLMSFWNAFRVYDETLVDTYVLRWLKDYHVYYELPHSFHEFIKKHDLAERYPEVTSVDDLDNGFNLFCSISKYDIKQSAFFTEDNAKLIADCFYHVSDKLRQICADHGIDFDESIFQPTKKKSLWTPFQSALFYPWIKEQADRRVVLSKHEIYVCTDNIWVFSPVIKTESGRQLIGYVMKQMESVLRKATKHKYKLTANPNLVSHPIVGKLSESGTSLAHVVTQATLEFYREATKTVVKVDPGMLSIIREEALSTQEKLIVPEREAQIMPMQQVGKCQNVLPQSTALTAPSERGPENAGRKASLSEGGGCRRHPEGACPQPEDLKSSLTEIEIKALSVIFHGKIELKKFADDCGIMLEVLVDGINEKAVDYMGDNLLDEDFALYDDYKEQVEEWIR